MSRIYNEEWERKKSYLIRSLFHDIPYQALSPVPECLEKTHETSTRSSDTQIPQDSTSSPDLYSESTTSPYDASLDSVAPTRGVFTTLDTRPCSPLPPLIIERMPNRHDDPPEYYQTLLTKIRKIYRKMFIEGISLNDNDFLDSENEKQSMMNEIFEKAASLSELSDVSRSSPCSDAYSADTEMSDIEESTNCSSNLLSIKVGNNEALTNKTLEVLISNTVHLMDNNITDNNKNQDLVIVPRANLEEMLSESFVSDEEDDYRQITTRAVIHSDGAQLTADRPSPVYEGAQVNVSPVAPIDGVILIQNLEQQPVKISNHMVKDPSTCPVVSKLSQKCTNVPHMTVIVDNEELPEYIPMVAFEGSTTAESALGVQSENSQSDALRVDDASLDIPMYPTEEIVTSPILQTIRLKKTDLRTTREKPAVSETQDTNHRPIIAQPERHSPPETQITQPHAFMLRFKKSTDHSLMEADAHSERKATDQGESQEPTPPTEDIDELINTDIEIMRTPRAEVSTESIPVDMTRHTSDMDLTCERIGNIPRDISSVTSDSQDGCHNNTVEPKTSCNVDELLKSIFNEISQENIERASESSNKKRSFEEMAAQTDNVSWKDLRANFFIGTPKILRLCSCTDHICN